MTLRTKIYPDYNAGLPPILGSAASFKSIADKLDAADGKKDGKIDKSIWNAYAKQVGGNQIKNYITVDNAAQAMEKYFKDAEGTAQDKLTKFYGAIPEETAELKSPTSAKSTTGTKSISETNPTEDKTDAEYEEMNYITDSKGRSYNIKFSGGEPVTTAEDTYITQKISGHQAIIDKDKNLRVIVDNPNDKSSYFTIKVEGDNVPQKSTPPKGDTPIPAWYGSSDISKVPFGDYHRLDSSGNLSMVYDGNSRLPKQEFFRDKNGKITGYVDYEYNDKGQISRKIFRKPDGSVEKYFETITYKNNNALVAERDASGNFVAEHLLARPEVFEKA